MEGATSDRLRSFFLQVDRDAHVDVLELTMALAAC
jgi:hypothetical protein